MKKFGLFLLLGLLVICLCVAGCSETSAPSGEEPAEEEPEETPEEEPEEASDETFELNYSYFGPEMIPPGQYAEEAARIIEEETDGRVKINTYYSESLLKYDDTLTGVSTGVADIVFIDSGILASQFDLNMVFTRFKTNMVSQQKANEAYRELIKSVPELNEELEAKGVRWLSIHSVPGSTLSTTNKLVRVPEDVKGMRIATVGEPAQWFELLGAAPVASAAGDFYMNLERGVVDGQWVHGAAMWGFSLYEVLNYYTLFGENGAGYSFTGFLINKDTWDSLPPDIQEIMVETYDWAGDRLAEANQEEVQMSLSAAEERGGEIVVLTPEELALWEESMDQINEKWVEETEAKGLPARETFDLLLKLLYE